MYSSFKSTIHGPEGERLARGRKFKLRCGCYIPACRLYFKHSMRSSGLVNRLVFSSVHTIMMSIFDRSVSRAATEQ